MQNVTREIYNFSFWTIKLNKNFKEKEKKEKNVCDLICRIFFFFFTN